MRLEKLAHNSEVCTFCLLFERLFPWGHGSRACVGIKHKTSSWMLLRNGKKKKRQKQKHCNIFFIKHTLLFSRINITVYKVSVTINVDRVVIFHRLVSWSHYFSWRIHFQPQSLLTSFECAGYTVIHQADISRFSHMKHLHADRHIHAICICTGKHARTQTHIDTDKIHT